MSSIRLVILSMVVGFAIGAGFMAARQPVGTVSQSSPTQAAKAPAHANGIPTGGSDPIANGLDDGYQRIATALLAIDERISHMEAREELNQEKHGRLLDQIREIAIALEIKSGNLKPLREGGASPLEPVRSRDRLEAVASEIPVPAARPDSPRAPARGDDMPEW